MPTKEQRRGQVESGYVTASRSADAASRYMARTSTSHQQWKTACHSYPEGVSGNGKFFSPYPVFMDRAEGATITDVDGNVYVDLAMGAGPMLLGHAHPRVLEAIREQAARLTNPVMPFQLAVEYAERIRSHMPYLERLRFTATGSEATRSALRVARSVTGRTRYAKFEGAYHGSDDVFLLSTHSRQLRGTDERPEATLDYAGLAPRLLDEVLVLPFNDAEASIALIEEHADELACVFMEPVSFSSGGAIPAKKDFAKSIRAVTDNHNIPLVFDEIVCAYRLGLEGAPGYLDVTPDLATIGKAIGGGLPLSAFGGRADLMAASLGPKAGEMKIFQSGTFTESPLSIAAGMATLDVLESEPALDRANDAGREIRRGLVDLFDSYDIECAVTGVGSIFHVHFGTSKVENRRDVVRANWDATRDFLLSLIAEGVFWIPVHPALTSAAHTTEHVKTVLAAATSVLGRWRKADDRWYGFGRT